MSETKHTPGPWKCKPLLTPERDEDPMLVYEIRHTGKSLQERFDEAEYDPVTDGYLGLDAIHAENRANARLIAAAPDGLKAAEDALLWWHSIPAHILAKEPSWVAECRAAIAKAKGE